VFVFIGDTNKGTCQNCVSIYRRHQQGNMSKLCFYL